MWEYMYMYDKDELSRLSISVGYIFVTGIAAKFARLIQSQLISSKFLQALILEFIATFELLATAFELGVVLVNHGFLCYAVLLMIMFIYWGKVWPPSMTAPHPHIVDILQRQGKLGLSVGKIFAQIVAATLVYNFYVKPIWSMGYREEHLRKVADTKCNSNLHITPYMGILTESGITFAFLLAGKVLTPKNYGRAAVPVAFVSLKRLALKMTGGFMNPILASTIQFGCEGITLQDHLLVYWLGPVLALLLFRIGSKLMEPTKEKAAVKETNKGKQSKTPQKKKKKDE